MDTEPENKSAAAGSENDPGKAAIKEFAANDPAKRSGLVSAFRAQREAVAQSTDDADKPDAEDTEEKPEPEVKPEAKAKPEKKASAREEPDKEDFDIDNIRGVSSKVTTKFKVFKEGIKTRDEKIAGLEKELNELKAKPAETTAQKWEETEEYKKLSAELQEKRDHVLKHDFENSPEFRERFTAPLQKIIEKRIKPFVDAVADRDDEAAAKLAVALDAATRIDFSDKKDPAFFDAVERALEDADMTTSNANRVRQAMSDWRDKSKEASEELKDWKAAREKLLKESDTAKSKSASAVGNTFEAQFLKWEKDNEAMIKVLREQNEVYKYDEEVRGIIPAVREHVERAARGDGVSNDLLALIQDGVKLQAMSKQYMMLARQHAEAVKQLQALKGAKAQKDKAGDGVGKTNGHAPKGEAEESAEQEDKYSRSSGLVATMRKAGMKF